MYTYIYFTYTDVYCIYIYTACMNICEQVAEFIPPGAPILSVSKGIETSSLCLMTDILKECCGSERSYAFLSGPSFAREIASNMATAVVIASTDTLLANDLAQLLSSPSFRCFTSKDVVSCHKITIYCS
jgi:glycerol-3-phosphate dehydrogenase